MTGWSSGKLGANKESIHLTGLLPDTQSQSMQLDATQIVTVAPTGVHVWYTHPKAKAPMVTHNIPNATGAVFVGNALLVGTSNSKAIVWNVFKKRAIKEMAMPAKATSAAKVMRGCSDGRNAPCGSLAGPRQPSSSEYNLPAPPVTLIGLGDLISPQRGVFAQDACKPR